MPTYNTLIGNEVPQTGVPRTQVYLATHTGNERLPYMYRSFISFTYGGKAIEDFNLIATVSGDRMERNAYASFEDLTTTYDTIQGQFYWGTYFHQNELTFNLATDAMTQNELDDFKYWFKPGSIRELILAEHPNRAIMARIANPPEFQLLPFEKEVDVPFYTVPDEKNPEVRLITSYTTSTTVYRGEIVLNFVMDEPFWYAIKNILGRQNAIEGYYEESWVDANGKVERIRQSKDALKIIYEDHIPLGSTTAVTVFLGGDVLASVKYYDWSAIAKSSETQPENWSAIMERRAADEASDEVYSYSFDEDTNQYWVGAHIATEVEVDGATQLFGGRIQGATMSEEGGSDVTFEANDDAAAHLYYAGTAPAPVKLSFEMSPQFDNGVKKYYINVPQNSYTAQNVKYNTITLESRNKHEFKFTTPSIWLAYNQVLSIFDNVEIVHDGAAWLTLRETIRDTIRHPVVRAWATRVIDRFNNGLDDNGTMQGTTINGQREEMKKYMKLLFAESFDSKEGFPATFSFDGATGMAIGEFSYRDVSQIPTQIITKTVDEETKTYEYPVFVITVNNQAVINLSDEIIKSVENVGDMVKSSYLILDERNVLDEYYHVRGWTETHPEYSYVIRHDLNAQLHNVHFEFQNLYL